MAKLYLKFGQETLKEYDLRDGSSITIGRMPDNGIHIDHLAVSGHHARIVWENDHFALEDNNSLNGTFVNNRRINRCALKNGDVILVGKHTISYLDEARRPTADQIRAEANLPPAPPVEQTVMLDSRKAGEMAGYASVAPANERVGQLTVVDGKTDQHRYVLSGKLTVIGKSDMASVKLKGFFAPKVAAVVNQRDGKYFIAASEKDVKVKINSSEISGQKELSDGDIIEVAHVKLTFSYE